MKSCAGHYTPSLPQSRTWKPAGKLLKRWVPKFHPSYGLIHLWLHAQHNMLIARHDADLVIGTCTRNNLASSSAGTADLEMQTYGMPGFCECGFPLQAAARQAKFESSAGGRAAKKALDNVKKEREADAAARKDTAKEWLS